jgi:hypothetical protein
VDSARAGDRAEIVFGCVAPPEEFRDAVLGAQGLVHGARMRVYVHLGTSGASLLGELATAHGARGVATIDAPITGGPPRARGHPHRDGRRAGGGARRRRPADRELLRPRRPARPAARRGAGDEAAQQRGHPRQLTAACEAMAVGARPGSARRTCWRC